MSLFLLAVSASLPFIFSFSKRKSLHLHRSSRSLWGNSKILIKTLKAALAGGFIWKFPWVSCPTQALYLVLVKFCFLNVYEVVIRRWSSVGWEPGCIICVSGVHWSSLTWLESQLCPECKISVYGASVLFQPWWKLMGNAIKRVRFRALEVINC